MHKIHFSSTLTVRERNKTELPENVNNSLIACVSSSCIDDSKTPTAHRSYQTHGKCPWNVVPLICECPLKLINRFRGNNSSTDASSKSSSHKCSMGLKSGDNSGQGRVRMWLSLRKLMVTREIWHLALYC